MGPRQRIQFLDMKRSKDIKRIEAAMNALSRLGQSRRFASLRARLANVELSNAAQLVLRGIVNEGPVRISDLARMNQMSDAAISRQVTALETSGFARRGASLVDGRVALVHPTEQGRKVSRVLQQVADEMLTSQLSEWSSEDIALVAGLMERLSEDLRRPRAQARDESPDREEP